MKHRLWLTLLGLLLSASWAGTAPEPAEKPKNVAMTGFSTRTWLVKCKGGERTLAVGATAMPQDRDPLERVLLALYVFDPNGNCIAHTDYHARGLSSKTDGAATGVVAAEWFPPETAMYTVVLRNQSPTSCDVELAIR